MWNVVWESYAGVLFFAMDSSLECFTHALNALGYLIRPAEFIDITNDQKLREITPANLLDPPKGNARYSAYGPCQRLFPRICAHWSANRDLITQIIEYHDSTKHRHSVVIGQGMRCHLLKPEPKQSLGKLVFNKGDGGAIVPHNEEYSLQSFVTSFQGFIVEWMRMTRQDLEAVFGQSLSRLSASGPSATGRSDQPGQRGDGTGVTAGIDGR